METTTVEEKETPPPANAPEPDDGSATTRKTPEAGGGIRFPVRLLVVALALGAGADLLFRGKDLGVSALVFTVLFVGALFGLGRREQVRPVVNNLWLLVPLLFFAAMVCARANAFLTFLNLCATLLLLGLVVFLWAAGRVETLGLLGYVLAPLRIGCNALFRAAPLVPAVVDLRVVQETGRRNGFPVLRGLLLAVPVLILFSSLLASADLVFARHLETLFHFQLPAAVEEQLGRIVFVLVVAWLVAGSLVYALARRDVAGVEATSERALTPKRSLGFVETATLLILVNALFGLFVRIQFAYLFGGSANVALGSFTFAEYARRGFFELAAVSLLTLWLVLGLRAVTRRETPAQMRGFNTLSSLLVGLVLVLLSSALRRMSLYEAAYGYTELRLYVHVFIIWLALTFLWFLVTLWRWPRRFAVGSFVACLGFLATLNVLHPDAFIARQNLARFQTTGKLDLGYLMSLSDDAVPALVHATRVVRGDKGDALRQHLQRRREILRAQTNGQSWPSFHLARFKADRALAARD